jgi:hypothetical protein
VHTEQTRPTTDDGMEGEVCLLIISNRTGVSPKSNQVKKTPHLTCAI